MQILIHEYERKEIKMTRNSPDRKEDSAGVNEMGSRQKLLQPPDPNEDINELREQLHQERDRHLRTLADFKNYRRHVEREGNKIAESSKRETLLPLLDVVDDVERMLPWTSDKDQPLMKGVRIIYHKLLALLEKQGVRPFDSVGKPFTPELHEAVATAEVEDAEPGTIIEDLRRGYLWNNELLRPAQVRVAG